MVAQEISTISLMDQTRYVNQTFYRDYGLEAKILRGAYSMHNIKELTAHKTTRTDYPTGKKQKIKKQNLRNAQEQ
ncbi:hypothetical protein K435DRAFT_863955 [Dendrothele bispora CBS 962.96]|uniref:Uncharacterized protein n=1 Tax=Dendrothele bispora (strain CBS 962.96) TaxID=1314807 RepID=A0A4S8LPS3_DENBC|nr:hypothetical protein K435DRAFT_863955 [Dendrothele bispora CBS 962.96]